MLIWKEHHYLRGHINLKNQSLEVIETPVCMCVCVQEVGRTAKKSFSYNLLFSINQYACITMGGQDSVVMHPVPLDIFTQTTQGRKVKQDKKPSKGEKESASEDALMRSR